MAGVFSLQPSTLVPADNKVYSMTTYHDGNGAVQSANVTTTSGATSGSVGTDWDGAEHIAYAATTYKNPAVPFISPSLFSCPIGVTSARLNISFSATCTEEHWWREANGAYQWNHETITTPRNYSLTLFGVMYNFGTQTHTYTPLGGIDTAGASHSGYSHSIPAVNLVNAIKLHRTYQAYVIMPVISEYAVPPGYAPELAWLAAVLGNSLSMTYALDGGGSYYGDVRERTITWSVTSMSGGTLAGTGSLTLDQRFTYELPPAGWR